MEKGEHAEDVCSRGRAASFASLGHRLSAEEKGHLLLEVRRKSRRSSIGFYAPSPLPPLHPPLTTLCSRASIVTRWRSYAPSSTAAPRWRSETRTGARLYSVARCWATQRAPEHCCSQVPTRTPRTSTGGRRCAWRLCCATASAPRFWRSCRRSGGERARRWAACSGRLLGRATRTRRCRRCRRRSRAAPTSPLRFRPTAEPLCTTPRRTGGASCSPRC